MRNPYKFLAVCWTLLSVGAAVTVGIAVWHAMWPLAAIQTIVFGMTTLMAYNRWAEVLS